MVFHAPHANDMDQFMSGSMRQMHLGGAHARLSVNIFGDIDFHVGTEENTHPSFAQGSLSFMIMGDLEKHFTSHAELSLEYDDSGQLGLDLERFQVGWHDDHFFVNAGRVHTAFGYWNNAYHHGKWLQPTTERPRWVEFEDSGGLLPIHTVGLSGGFSADVGRGKLRTTLSVSNGRGNIVDDIRNSFDYQDSKAVHAQIEYIGLGLSDLRVGIAGMYDRIARANADVRPALPGVPIDEYIASAHIAYPSYPLLVVIEGYGIEHHVPGHAYFTYGGFATFGYAYLRGQWIATKGGRDPFFFPDPSTPITLGELEGIAGVRVDLTDWTAIRAEYNATSIADQKVVHRGTLQWCWGF